MSNNRSMAYLLSNICTKNYWNLTTVVEIIVGGCVSKKDTMHPTSGWVHGILF